MIFRSHCQIHENMMINHLKELLLNLFAFELIFLIFYPIYYLKLIMMILYLLILLIYLYLMLFLGYYFLSLMKVLLLLNYYYYYYYYCYLFLLWKLLSYGIHHKKFLLDLNLLCFEDVLVNYNLKNLFVKVDHIHYFPNHKFYCFLFLLLYAHNLHLYFQYFLIYLFYLI